MSCRQVAALATLGLLALFLTPTGVAQTQNGYFERSEPGGPSGLLGHTIYRVHYEMPAVFKTNKTEQVRVWMNVTQFSQTTSEVEARSVQVMLTVNKREFVRMGGLPQSLKPGEIWGPFTFEFFIADVQIGLGPGQAADLDLKMTVDVVEYWYQPLTGAPSLYPKSFSNEKEILGRIINPEKPSQSSFDMLTLFIQQLGAASIIRLVIVSVFAGGISLSIRFIMPRQFLPLLLAGGLVFVLVGVLLPVFELAVFGFALIVLALILYVFTHRGAFF